LEQIFAIIFSLPPLETLLTLGILVVAKAFDSRLRTYATYILSNPETGQVYVGRCSGYGNLEKIIFRRLYSHKYYKRGFTVIQLDKAIQGKKLNVPTEAESNNYSIFMEARKTPM